MSRRRGNKVEVFVQIANNARYGFNTQERIVNNYSANLGLTRFTGQSGTFFGANSPKPARATFKDTTGNVSCFCSNDKIAELRKTEGWSLQFDNSIRGIRTSGKTRTVYVDMPGGWKYAWNITAAEADLATVLGFELAGASDANELMWGVQDPKPPRASLQRADGVVSTFIKPQVSVIERATAAGWNITSVNYDLLPAA